MLTGRVYSIKTPGNVGSDSNDGLSWNTAFATFDHAIKTAAAGDTICVAAGTYTENIQSSKKQLTFKGGYPANGGDTQNFTSNVTILDGGHSGVVLMTHGDNTVIQGFTVTHGSRGIVISGQGVQVSDCIITSNDRTSSYDGMGVHNYGKASFTNCAVTDNGGHGLYNNIDGQVTISGCTFKDNAGVGARLEGYTSATITNSILDGNSLGGLVGDTSAECNATDCTFRNNSNSGGVSMEWQGVFTNCLFENNYAATYSNGVVGSGGGISGSGTLENCTFTGNHASGSGGGIHLHGTVTGCNITSNTAANGGGVYGDYSEWGIVSTVENSTIANNTASEDGGGVSRSEIVNCTVTGNRAARCGGMYGYISATNCTIINNTADLASEHYMDDHSAPYTVGFTNTIIYNSSVPYIYNENTSPSTSLRLTNCATAERSIYGAGNTEQVSTVNIADWSASHPAEAVSADNVAHTVFRLKAGDTALIHGGTSEGAPETDQLGNSRDTAHPSIGAVEYSSGSGNSNTIPETPSNEDNSGTSPETPSNDGNGGTSPETPSNEDNGSTTPDTPTESTGGSGGGGCNAFCGLITFAILFTLKRK